MEALPWVKCPTKANRARNIHDYGKTIITSYRSHSPGAGNGGAPPRRSGPGAACRVNASPPDKPRAPRLGRWGPVTAHAAATLTTTATVCRGGRLAVRPSRSGRPELTRGSGVPLPVRGALSGGCRIARAALCHAFRRGQEAYSASDGTRVLCSGRQPPRSRGASLTGTLDLLSTTVSNPSCV